MTKLLWTETQSNVAIEDGLFSVMLGSVDPVGQEVITGMTLWLTLRLLPAGDELILEAIPMPAE